MYVRAVKPLQFPRPASSASDTDDDDDDKEDEDEGPRPYGIAGKPLSFGVNGGLEMMGSPNFHFGGEE